LDRRVLNKLKFHLTKLLSEPRSEDWERVFEALDALEGQAADARTAQLQRLLAADAPLLRQGRFPSDVKRLLHAIEQATQREAGAPTRELSREERLAQALRGRALLLIGGDPRLQHAERLKDSLQLAEVLWPVTREDAPDLYSLEPLVARADVAAVVLLVRFVRHALNDVDELCARHSKPLARCTAGYNPVQVVAALAEQCGRRLGL